MILFTETELRETITEYIADLHRLATHCEFKTFLDGALRDKLVHGISSKSIREKQLTEKDLTVAWTVKVAQGMEAAVNFGSAIQLQLTEEKVVQRVAAPQASHTQSKNKCYDVVEPATMPRTAHLRMRCATSVKKRSFST